MLKIIMLFAALALAGCSSGQAYNDRIVACRGLAEDQGRGAEWQNKCTTDNAVFSEGFYTKLENTAPEKLCYFVFIDPKSPSGITSAEVAEKRGINCAPYHSKMAQNVVKNSNMLELCAMWHQNFGVDSLIKAVRSEVKDRDVNCPDVISAEAQTQQARAARAQAAAAMMGAFKPAAPTHTNCYTFGNQVNCSSY